jgi:hypothetical protein
LEVFAYLHEQPFGFGSQIWDRMSQFIDGVVFTTVYFSKFPESQIPGIIERFQWLYPVLFGNSKMFVVQVVE